VLHRRVRRLATAKVEELIHELRESYHGHHRPHNMQQASAGVGFTGLLLPMGELSESINDGDLHRGEQPRTESSTLVTHGSDDASPAPTREYGSRSCASMRRQFFLLMAPRSKR